MPREKRVLQILDSTLYVPDLCNKDCKCLSGRGGNTAVRVMDDDFDEVLASFEGLVQQQFRAPQHGSVVRWHAWCADGSTDLAIGAA
jgi:hypothetical protein